MMNWWLERGVDGFRIDARRDLKRAGLPDGAARAPFGVHSAMDGPACTSSCREMNERTFSRHRLIHRRRGIQRVTRVRALFCDPRVTSSTCSFSSNIVTWDSNGVVSPSPLRPGELAEVARSKGARGTGGWNALYPENHDQPRKPPFGDPDNLVRVATAPANRLLPLNSSGRSSTEGAGDRNARRSVLLPPPTCATWSLNAARGCGGDSPVLRTCRGIMAGPQCSGTTPQKGYRCPLIGVPLSIPDQRRRSSPMIRRSSPYRALHDARASHRCRDRRWLHDSTWAIPRCSSPAGASEGSSILSSRPTCLARPPLSRREPRGRLCAALRLAC